MPLASFLSVSAEKQSRNFSGQNKCKGVEKPSAVGEGESVARDKVGPHLITTK